MKEYIKLFVHFGLGIFTYLLYGKSVVITSKRANSTYSLIL